MKAKSDHFKESEKDRQEDLDGLIQALEVLKTLSLSEVVSCC